jgi:uncharacterized FlaG/YvyC family protein
MPEKKEVAHAQQQTTHDDKTSHVETSLSQAQEPLAVTAVSQTVAFANAIADLFNTKLSFNYDERINQVVVRVQEGGTDEVIRQIPPEQMIELAAKFKSQARGLILNHQG